ncbi:MAG TPA: TetR/AcrR family transcriptional regulator [Anaerolineales bacterium]
MQRRSENTRARLLASALNHFALHGYDATSVEDICLGANVSKGAFYHHFESKQALFLSLLQTWLTAIDDGFAAIGKSSVPDTLLAMTDILPAVLTAASDQLPMFLEFWLQASRDEKVWKASIEPYQHFREYFSNMVAKGIAEGTLRSVDPQVSGRVILSMAIGLLLQAVLEPEEGNWARTAREGMQILMKGLAT